MVREFTLPDVGEGVAEGELVRWLVEPGDAVSEDQPVAEVETDKALVELPSPVNGTVRELHAEAGDIVPVGDVVVTFDVEGEEAEPASGEDDGERTPADTDVSDAESTAGSDEVEEQATAGGRVFAPPSARRLARELDVDISQVDGSGPGGRITEGDVQAAAGETDTGEAEDRTGEQPTGTEPEAAPETTGDSRAGGASAAVHAEPAERDRTLAAPATRRIAREAGIDIDAVPAVEERDGEAFVTVEAVQRYAEAQRGAQAADTAALSTAAPTEREEREPYRGVRRTIGEAMERSKFTAPHVTHHDSVVVDRLVQTREELKPYAESHGVTLTYLPFVMKAIVAALQEYPYLNSRLDEENEEIVKLGYYNLGIAVATDAGLMVPVVEDVDRKDVLQLASESNELAQKARERSISPDELRGSTFTITNFGATGGEYATPIINYPEVAILGLGRLEQRPVVRDGEVVAAYTLPLSLSIDHRVVDGAVAAAFVNTLKEYLANPARVLVE